MDNYKSRIIKEISNTDFYTPVTNTDTAISEINTRIQSWIDKYCEEVAAGLQSWIVDNGADFGYFYMNYKAHKPEKGFPGRMITSGCGSPTERLSSWFEYHLKPLMKKLPYRLDDTSHFLRKLIEYNNTSATQEDNPKMILCSWDIEAMYPNITNDLGLTACRELLKNRDHPEPSTECIVEAVKITLEENIARFGDLVVKQCDGTAMGPHHACSYADIAADYAIDQKVMALHINPFHSKIKQWSRFRDDIFCIWYGSEDLLDFDARLNNLHPHLKLTKDYSTSSIVFLDLRLTISGNQVISGMYSKPSDTHSYLMPTSCHPSHICKNIPHGVMKRVKRNCSSDEICNEGYSKFKQHLIRRGYSSTIVDEAIEQAISTPREVLLGSVNSNDIDTPSKRQFPLVMKFNPKLPPMFHYIHKHFHILELSSKSTHLFNKRTIFTSYKMGRNILSMITKNNFKLPSTLQLPPATRSTLVHTLTFNSPKTSQTYKIKAHINCNTKNIIYLILDLKCPDIFYVGYTTDCMAVRWRNHKSHQI